MKYLDLMKDGIFHKNPIFVQVLALCPLLAVTTSAVNALTMGLATTAVMICASAVVSIFRKIIPTEIRIAAAVIIVAGFVTVVELLLDAYAPPDITASLGIYIPLIVVNCILFARLESFASKNKVFASIIDALGMGLGFTIGLFIVGLVREFLGSGAVFGIELLHDQNTHMLIMIMPAGAFFTLGVIIMIRKHLQLLRLNAKKKAGR
ncbi:MAG: electron transport complex subunit E [Treponema sp.]|nr:electron transport complex subunit E [Treponema sp.]